MTWPNSDGKSFSLKHSSFVASTLLAPAWEWHLIVLSYSSILSHSLIILFRWAPWFLLILHILWEEKICEILFPGRPNWICDACYNKPTNCLWKYLKEIWLKIKVIFAKIVIRVISQSILGIKQCNKMIQEKIMYSPTKTQISFLFQTAEIIFLGTNKTRKNSHVGRYLGKEQWGNRSSPSNWFPF